MEIIKVIILGIVQGLTEFLPVSSSGHLVIFQQFFGMETEQLTLEVFLHFGTLIPVFIIFWQDIKDILSFKKEKRRLTYLILIGIIPTGLMGFYLHDFFTRMFSSLLLVGFMLLITGFILFLSEKIVVVTKDINDLKEHNAIIIGIAQGMAMLPGISRSGSTIVASLFQGLNREDAARYSFLLSIPVILGASLLEAKEAMSVGLIDISVVQLILGTIAAAFSGYFAIKCLLQVLKKGSLLVFSYYCWTIGILIILRAGLF